MPGVRDHIGGSNDDEALHIAVTFTRGEVNAFVLDVDTLEVRLGTYVTLSARDLHLDTGAAGSTDELVSFTSVGARVAIGSLVLM